MKTQDYFFFFLKLSAEQVANAGSKAIETRDMLDLHPFFSSVVTAEVVVVVAVVAVISVNGVVAAVVDSAIVVAGEVVAGVSVVVVAVVVIGVAGGIMELISHS